MTITLKVNHAWGSERDAIEECQAIANRLGCIIQADVYPMIRDANTIPFPIQVGPQTFEVPVVTRREDLKTFGVLAASQCVSYALICWNYRAIAKGWIPQTVISDILFAAITFKILKRVAAAKTNIAWAGYVLGGALGSALSVYLTKLIWGE